MSLLVRMPEVQRNLVRGIFENQLKHLRTVTYFPHLAAAESGAHHDGLTTGARCKHHTHPGWPAQHTLQHNIQNCRNLSIKLSTVRINSGQKLALIFNRARYR